MFEQDDQTFSCLQTLKRLELTTRWQTTTRPEQMVCTACAKDPR